MKPKPKTLFKKFSIHEKYKKHIKNPQSMTNLQNHFRCQK